MWEKIQVAPHLSQICSRHGGMVSRSFSQVESSHRIFVPLKAWHQWFHAALMAIARIWAPGRDSMRIAMIPSLKLTVPPWWLGDYFPFGKAMLGLCWFLGRVVTVFLADHRWSLIVFLPRQKNLQGHNTMCAKLNFGMSFACLMWTQMICRPKIPVGSKVKVLRTDLRWDRFLRLKIIHWM